MTHPFHPWHGREFVFLGVRQNWSQERVFFLDERGVQRSLPVEWTDAIDPDVFVTLAAGRCALRVTDLVVLAQLIDGLGGGDEEQVYGEFCHERKRNYAGPPGEHCLDRQSFP